MIMRETRYQPVYYLPRADVRMDLLQQSDHRTHCPFKGNATYWHIAVGDKTVENAAWSYEDPLPDAAEIKDYIAFYWNKMDALYEEDKEVAIDPGAAGHEHNNPFVDWLMREAWDAATTEELVDRLIRRLVAAGIPLLRFNLLLRTLNPQILSNAYIWKRGQGGVEVRTLGHEVAEGSAYLNSPLVSIYEGAGGVRRRLDTPDAQFDYPILKDLHDEGATDYVAMPLKFSDGQINVLTLASDRPGGFSTGDLGQIYEILPVLSRFFEVQALRRTTKSLLDTYLGAHTGELVLSGRIKRGDGQDIPAVVWYCDLRNSTGLADKLSREDYLSLLNQFFDNAAGAVLAAGGEVLKFIGDAVLAIFPVEECPIKTSGACEAALAAAREMEDRMVQLNRQRGEDGKEALGYGLALHLGEVTYGNVGASGRLDFTVIGPAANEAERLAALCKTLKRTVLVSEAFAKRASVGLVCLGEHRLRGVSGRHEIYSLPNPGEAGHN
jgi:class 3 adenylate cyclase